MLLALFTPLILSSQLAFASKHHYQNNQNYEDGHLGEYPVETYKTTTYLGPKQDYFAYQAEGSCLRDDDLYTLLTPRGTSVPYPGPVVLDSQGSLLWTEASFGEPYDLQVQTYLGQQYLTFWAGNDLVVGHGEGKYYMINSSYHLTNTVTAANNLQGDLHEFSILPNNNALLTVYATVEADLHSNNYGPSSGWIWDGIFQEINIETGEAVFEWHASDHILLTESMYPRTEGTTPETAWDWFHINSIDKDDKGNYLISARYMHALYYIDGITGDVIWALGGKSNMFLDITSTTNNPDLTPATQIARQHHARWQEDYTSITLFNNGMEEAGQVSSGMWIDIDTNVMIVSTRQTYIAPNRQFGESQGSMQILPNGDVLVGYGHEAQYTEFSPDGRPLCDVHFGPRSGFRSAAVQSYRVLKHTWVGRPDTIPDVVVQSDAVADETRMYISWMGATEVKSWQIEGKRYLNDTEAVVVDVLTKDGFETSIDLNAYTNPLTLDAVQKRSPKTTTNKLRYFLAVALDINGTALSESGYVDVGRDITMVLPVDTTSTTVSPAVITICAAAIIIGTAPLLWLLHLYISRLSRGRRRLVVLPDNEKHAKPEKLLPLITTSKYGYHEKDCGFPTPDLSTFVHEYEVESDTAYDSDYEGSGGDRSPIDDDDDDDKMKTPILR